MLEEGFLERWENAMVTLDENGESEAYFPLWGFADPDLYLARSDRLREELTAEAEAAMAAAEAEASAEDAAGDGALEVPLEHDAPPPPDVKPAATRVAWGALYGAKRVLLIVLVCMVGSLLVTMAMNPEMTFFDVIDLFVSKGADLIARIRGE